MGEGRGIYSVAMFQRSAGPLVGRCGPFMLLVPSEIRRFDDRPQAGMSERNRPKGGS